MKNFKKNIVFTLILICQLTFISCNKEEELTNELVGTEWSDQKGIWLFSFQDNTSLNLVYKIPKSPHAYNFNNLPYVFKDNKLTITNYQFDYHGKKYFLIKDFKATIKEQNMFCNFKTPTTEVAQGSHMPDLSKLVTSNVILSKK